MKGLDSTRKIFGIYIFVGIETNMFIEIPKEIR